MKKKIFLVFIISLCLCVMTGCGCNKKDNPKNKKPKEDNTAYEMNTHKGIVEDKELNGLKFTKASLKTSDYYSTLVTKVENTTNKDIYVRVFNIYFKDKDGNRIVKIIGYVGGVVPANDSRNITTNVTTDLKNAYDVEYEIVE